MCLSDKLPLLQNVRTGPIDPDTPESAQTKTDKDGTKLKLVFSDEFSKPGRTFYDGDDPYFQAVDIWYGATQDMEWYDPDAVSTANGTLNLQFDAFQSHNLNYRSGMVQSWNKLCYKGGRIEASISLPGRGDIQGFWPGFWTMGNLGRPGYLATTDGMWPYSYHDECDAGITKNQSSSDGLSWLPGMRLPACTCDREDHPTPGKSRQAPEIDAIEASVGFMIPGGGGATGTASQSFQAAPFDIWYQPDYDYTEIYDTAVTEMNTYRGGPFQQALSGVTWLNNDWYDGKAYQTYGFEYEPGAKGKVAWFVGDTYTWTMDTRATRANGNIGQRVLPEEPMSIIMNFGLSNSFAQVFLADLAKLMPATMRLDYVRIYQEEGKESLTCDPEGYETTEYIKAHPEPYANPNLTLW
jgi:beta-glucanase (GH16 family)